MKKNGCRLFIALIILFAYQKFESRSLAKQEDGAANQTNPAIHFDLTDAAGQRHTAHEWKSARAVAFFFIGAECPISNRYAPEINQIVADYSSRGVIFYGVHSDPDINQDVALRHAHDFGFSFPILLDPAQTLAGSIGVLMTPTAVILSPAGELLYRGRIDSRNLDYGKYRVAGFKPDLRLALDSVIAGKPVEEKFTKSIGCALPSPREQATSHHAQQ